MSELKKAVLAGGCFWMSQSGGLAQEVASYFDVRKNSDNLNSACKAKRDNVLAYA